MKKIARHTLTDANQLHKQLSSSKSSSSNHILGIRQMRHKNQVSIKTDIVAAVADGVYFCRVDVGDCLAVVYPSKSAIVSYSRG